MSGTTSTGDGLGGGVSGGSAFSGSAPKGRTPEDTAAKVAALMAVHGTPGKVNPQAFSAKMNQIHAKFGAKSSQEKEDVLDTLTYLFVVHGTSPEAAWDEIDAQPPSCRPLKMSEIVDNVISRKFLRRFATHFSDRAVNMVRSSNELTNALVERAVRSGLPATDPLGAVDFLDMTKGGSNGVIADRIRAKNSAVSRANKASRNGLEVVADRTASAMRGGNLDDDVVEF